MDLGWFRTGQRRRRPGENSLNSMSKSTRSKQKLPEDIHRYMMEENRHVRDEVVDEENEAANDVNNLNAATGQDNAAPTFQSLLAGLPTDISQLQTLLMQSMLTTQAQQWDNQEIQKKNQELMEK